MKGALLKRHSVFLGASGSGKTELSVNCALRAARTQERQVCFFDMDQTKGLFRSRDLFDILSQQGVEAVEAFRFQDAPVVPAGVASRLFGEHTLCVLDVGGNSSGAAMVGQYAGLLRRNGADYYYVINPCRPFTDTAEDLEQTMAEILRASGASPGQLRILSNPHMGPETTVELVLTQHRRLEALLDRFGMKPAALCAAEGLASALPSGLPVIPLRLYLRRFY